MPGASAPVLSSTGASSIRSAPMKVAGLEILRCDAGWRNYHFLKLTTDDSIVGWSEFDEGFGSPRVSAVILDRTEPLTENASGGRPGETVELGKDPFVVEDVLPDDPRIEPFDALLDAKAKALRVPCYVLLGGKVRDRVRVYWSHCATWRVNHPTLYKPAITQPQRCRGARRRSARQGLHCAQDQHLPLRGREAARLAARLRRALPPRVECRQGCAAQRADPSRGDARWCGTRCRPAARPQLQRQDRGVSQDPEGVSRFRHVLGRGRQLQPRGARLYPAAEPASGQLVRDPARIARVPAVFP